MLEVPLFLLLQDLVLPRTKHLREVEDHMLRPNLLRLQQGLAQLPKRILRKKRPVLLLPVPLQQSTGVLPRHTGLALIPARMYPALTIVTRSVEASQEASSVRLPVQETY